MTATNAIITIRNKKIKANRVIPRASKVIPRPKTMAMILDIIAPQQAIMNAPTITTPNKKIIHLLQI